MIKVESEYAETMDLCITVHGYNRNRSIIITTLSIFFYFSLIIIIIIVYYIFLITI